MLTAIVTATSCVLILLNAYFLLTAYSSLLSAISVTYLQLPTFQRLFTTLYVFCLLPAVCYLPTCLLFCHKCLRFTPYSLIFTTTAGCLLSIQQLYWPCKSSYAWTYCLLPTCYCILLSPIWGLLPTFHLLMPNNLSYSSRDVEYCTAHYIWCFLTAIYL